MRAQAQRSSAANRDGSATRGSVFGRILSATRASFRNSDGSGAPSVARSGSGALVPAGALRFAVVSGALLVAAFLVFAPRAAAVPLVEFSQFGAVAGGDAGQIKTGEGVAVNRSGAGAADPGDVYVAEGSFQGNNRISQFDDDGNFIRAWGWDVISPGSPGNLANDEEQTVTLGANTTGGTYVLRFGGTGTANRSVPIAWDASPATVQSALEGVTAIGAGNVAVTSPNPGGGVIGGPYTVTFQGALADTDVAQMTSLSTGLVVSAGTKQVAIATSNQGASFEVCDPAADDTCQAGTASAAAGGLNRPSGIAVDQGTGNVYVTDNFNQRIAVYSADGEFQGAFGWKVNAGAPAEQLQFCTTATGCQAGSSIASAGGFSDIATGAVAVDPSDGNLWVGDSSNRRLNEFSFTLNVDDEVTDVAFERAVGWNVDASSPAEEMQECTTATGCKGGTFGPGDGQLDQIKGVAVDSSGSIYATSTSNFECTVSRPCRVQKFNSDGTFNKVFGPTFGGEETCQIHWENGAFVNANPVSGRPPAQVAYGVAVNPVDQHVWVTRKTGGNEADFCEFDPSGAKVSRSPKTGPLPASVSATHLSIAFGTEERAYVQIGSQADNSWPVRIFGAVPAAAAEVLDASDITATSATLNGRVTVPEPGGPGFDVAYRFEYSADNGFSWTRVPADADASVGTTVAGVYEVQQEILNLLPNFTYRVRLITTTSFTTTSEVASFTTAQAPPTIVAQRPTTEKTTADLEAKINPNGLPTNYRFEWGPDTSYANRIPTDHELSAGDSWTPVRFFASIGGLEEGAVYYFRVVATNSAGTTVGPDQRFQTLNAHGLVNNRGIELVSPADKAVGAYVGVGGLGSPAAPSAEDGQSVLYPLLNGLEDADSGANTDYLARRSPSGWLSEKASPPSLVASPFNGPLGQYASGHFLYHAPDLSCSIVFSHNPLTDDTPQAGVEVGVYNLYVRYDDGTYRLITDRAPANPEQPAIDGTGNLNTRVAGASEDCSRVYFESSYEYFPDATGLYEWEDGILHDAGTLPPDGDPGTGVVPATGSFVTHRNLRVSPSGSRLAFEALSQDPDTAGRAAVFLRDDGNPVEVSKRQGGSTHSLGASFEMLAPDGSHVFFLATYGLTADTSSGPAESCANVSASDNDACDLYAYEIDTGELTDLSATSAAGNTSGAVVKQVLGVSDNGQSVYFAARGQLVPGEGRTYAQNAGSSANVYLARGSQLTYVATIHNVVTDALGSRSHVTPDGDHLLFQTAANVTGYDSGGAAALAYLYSADSGTTVCVSCPPDGAPSLRDPSGLALLLPRSPTGGTHVMNDDGSRVFFVSEDPLAHGAVAGNKNVYEWEDGQVSLLVTGGPVTNFYGTSRSGDDVFVSTAERLTAHDTDSVSDLYDFRVGGGFPDPPVVQAPCDPSAGECEGAPSAEPDSADSATSGFEGKGNASPGAARNRCVVLSRRARALSKRATTLRRQARRASRAGNPRAARRSANRARRAARAARRNAVGAKRCARSARSANNNRGGVR